MLDPELGELVRKVVELPGFVNIGIRTNRVEKNNWFEVRFELNKWYIREELSEALELALEKESRWLK